MKKRWYNNSIEEKLISDNEDIPAGFNRGRLPKEKRDICKLISKQDLFQYYIIEQHSVEDVANHFNVKRHIVVQLNQIYDIHKDKSAAMKSAKRTRTHESYINGGKKSSATQKASWENKSEEEKQKWSEKQSKAHSTEHFKILKAQQNKDYRNNLSGEEKERQDKLRSESCKKTWQSKELIKKQKEAMKQARLLRKGQLCKTLSEQRIYDKLITLYPDVEYDVNVDDRYPYCVDFYIPQFDLFIEYNGHPSHGICPYDSNDPIAVNESHKLYGEWLNTYVKRDIEKYNIAKQNNINYIRIYPKTSLENNYKINEGKYKDIVKIIYNS